MFEQLLVEHCAPTLAGIKTANLFSYSGDDALSKVRQWNRLLYKLRLRLTILSNINGKTLIYIYRIDLLDKTLSDSKVRDFLNIYGYDKAISSGRVIKNLSIRVKKDNFPHEIGVFLGYPLEDVKLFIINKGKNYKISGIWKVYTDEAESMKLFEMYKKCTSSLCESFLKGVNIQSLCAA
jgi:hypothetical protein